MLEAVFDTPHLVVACGEAETGPLATAWHSNKFLDPDGAAPPMTAGFMGKFYCLRLTMTLFAGMSEAQTPGPDFLALPWIGTTLLVVLVILLIWLGIYPAPFIRMVQAFVVDLD